MKEQENLQKKENESIIVPAVQVVLMREAKGVIEVFLGHRIAGSFLDQWSFPGGKIDEGETSPQAAKRELNEEAGVEISEVDLKFLRNTESSTVREKGGRRIQYNYLMTVFTVNAQELVPYNASTDEHSEMRWISLSDALSMHDQAVEKEQMLGVSRSADKIPGALAPRTYETVQFLSLHQN